MASAATVACWRTCDRLPRAARLVPFLLLETAPIFPIIRARPVRTFPAAHRDAAVVFGFRLRPPIRALNSRCDRRFLSYF